MRKLITFIQLPAADRKILLRACCLLWVVRIGLWILPFQSVRSLLSRMNRESVTAVEGNEWDKVREIVRSVKLMSRYLPAATCLVQALVVISLLEQAGLPGLLRIGVVRTGNKLEAHAWVESLGRVVIGGTDVDLSRFTVLQTVEGT